MAHGSDKIYPCLPGGVYKVRVSAAADMKLVGGSSQFFPYCFHDELTVLKDLTVGDGANNYISCTGDMIAYSSDKRLKDNIVDIANPLEKLNRLRGVYFTWNAKAVEAGFKKSITNTPEIGMIAQELENVIPDAVKRAPFDKLQNRKLYDADGNRKNNEEPYKTVQLEKVIPLLIECVKEQQKQIEQLRSML
jgi:hypothetical protein